MGMVFDLSEVQTRVQEMVSYAQNYHSQIGAITQNVVSFDTAKELKGAAYSAAKSYFSGVIEPLCRGGQYLCETLESSALDYLSKVNTIRESETYLDQADLEDRLWDVQRQIDQLEECKAAYRLYERTYQSTNESLSPLKSMVSPTITQKRNQYLQIRGSEQLLYALKKLYEKRLRILENLEAISHVFRSLNSEIERWFGLLNSCMTCYQDGNYQVSSAMLKRCKDYTHGFFNNSILGEEELDRLLEMYSIKELQDIDAQIKGQEGESLDFLMKAYSGDYSAATLNDPYALTPEAVTLMTSHLMRLAECGEVKDIEDFTNAIFECIYIPHESDYKQDILKNKNPKGYIEVFETVTHVWLEKNYEEFKGYYLLTEVERAELKRQQRVLENLAIYYATLRDLSDAQGAMVIKTGEPTEMGTSSSLLSAYISELSYDASGFEFDFEKLAKGLAYQPDPKHPNQMIYSGMFITPTGGKQKVKNVLNTSLAQVVTSEWKAYLTEKEHQKDGALWKYSYDAIKAVIVAWQPYTVIGFALLEGLNKDSREGVYDLYGTYSADKDPKNAQKAALGFAAFESIMGYCEEMDQIDKEIDEKTYETFIALFGTTGGYEVIGEDGKAKKTYIKYRETYNLNVLERMIQWNEGGLQVICPEGKYEDYMLLIKEKLELSPDASEKEIRAKLSPELEKAIYGGYLTDKDIDSSNFASLCEVSDDLKDLMEGENKDATDVKTLLDLFK